MEALKPWMVGWMAMRWAKALATALALAWVLTVAPRSLLANFLLILAGAVALRVWAASAPPGGAPAERGPRARARRAPGSSAATSGDEGPAPGGPRSARPRPAAHSWRDHVRSRVVEAAWETLCGSIVQEFIYDTWYHYLTPDKEFPAEIRRILNYAFGQGAARARGIDLRLLMEDASELVMEQLELFRDTRETVLAARERCSGGGAEGAGALEAALRRRMQADGNLHPALLHADGDYLMLRSVAEGIAGLLLDPADGSRTAVRAVSRELLAGCVLRPLMMWCTPYHVNRGLYRLLEGRARRAPPPAGAAPHAAAARAKSLQGHWAFEQRIVAAVEAEADREEGSRPPSRCASVRDMGAMPPPPPRHPRHARSRSDEGLAPAAAAAVREAAGGGGSTLSSASAAAAPARFWSETAAGTAEEEEDDVQPHSATAALPGMATAAAVGLPPLEVSGASATSQASESSANCPVRRTGPPSEAYNASERPQRPSVSVESAPAAVCGGGAPSARTLSHTSAGAASTDASTLLRPSPFDDVSSASFTGGAAAAAPPPRRAASESGAACAPSGHFVAPSAPSSGVAEGPAPRPSPTATLSGFDGAPRARVVAADLNTAGAKDFVVYKVRVGDDSGREWTVSRRYRHFEVLHRQLRAAVAPAYRSRLPPKRIFIHTQSEDFVEDRRAALDAYLQEVLAAPALARSGDVWEFLRAGSERFELVGGAGGGGGGGVSAGDGTGIPKRVSGGAATLKRGLSRTVMAGATSMKRGVGVVVDVGRGVGEVTVGAAVDGMGAVISEARSGLAGLRHRRSASVPEELQGFDPTGPSGAAGERGAEGGEEGGGRRPDPLTRAGTGILRTATASARKVRNVLMPQPSGNSAESAEGGGEGSRRGGAAAARALHFGGVALSDGSDGGASAPGGSFIRSARSVSPTKQPRGMQRRGTIAAARAPRGLSPVKLRRAATAGASLGLAERSAAFAPGFQPPHMGAPPPGSNPYEEAALDLSGLSDPGLDVPLATIEVDAFGAASPGPSPAGGRPPRSPPAEPAAPPPAPFLAHLSSSMRAPSDLDLDSYAGISAPLYELVDCVFQLQTRGFFRRQVYAVARQVLSMAIGDAIDVYLLAKLRALRQEATLGAAIQLIQSSLWPGGTWFQRTPAFRAAHPELAAAAAAREAAREAATPTTAARDGPPPGMLPERYLEPAGPPPLDAEEVAEAVWELLARRAPTALVRLVGRSAYSEGVQDLYEMARSPTFMKQLGYGALEILTLHMCPELRGIFQTLDAVGVD